jgi:hypothetical protein
MQLNSTPQVPLDHPRQSRPAQEEMLVVDSRAGLTPSQMVERKLRGLLGGSALPVSQLLDSNRGRGPG